MDREKSIPIDFFEHAKELLGSFKEKELFVFLDYDGTLTPIVATPDLAVISEGMRETVKELASKVKVAIVSGRATDDVRSKVKIDQVFYAGSHGFEIVTPNGEVKVNEQAQKICPVIDEAHKKLVSRLATVEGALVEHVKFTISTHYRLVAEKDFYQIEQAVDDILKEYPMLRKTSGKKVFEIRPQVDWHKGKAVDWILNEIGADEKIVPVYIGDDTTDEDAFDVLKEKGFGVLVSDPPKTSIAKYLVKNTNEVKKVLEMFIEFVESEK